MPAVDAVRDALLDGTIQEDVVPQVIENACVYIVLLTCDKNADYLQLFIGLRAWMYGCDAAHHLQGDY